MRLLVANGPMQTTAAFAPVATGNAIKTMLQVKPFVPVRIVEWGISFDAFAAVLPNVVGVNGHAKLAVPQAEPKSVRRLFAPHFTQSLLLPEPAEIIAPEALA